MLVAVKASKWDGLTRDHRRGLRACGVRVRLGNASDWEQPNGTAWYVWSDHRLTHDDIAVLSVCVQRPNKFARVAGKAWDDGISQTGSESSRKKRQRKVRRVIEGLVVDWDRGVIGTEIVIVQERQRVQVGTEQVSRGMFCIDWDEDGEGECLEWEERFRTVPVWKQVNLKDENGVVVRDEDGNPIKVDKWVTVDVEIERDVYVTGQEVADLQGDHNRVIRVSDLGNLRRSQPDG